MAEGNPEDEWVPVEYDGRSSIIQAQATISPLKCSGRGQNSKRPVPAISLQLPDVLIEYMDRDLMKGMGRARIFQYGETKNKPLANSSAKIKILNESHLQNRSKFPGESAGKTSSLNEALLTANDRFKSYETLKHHPAKRPFSEDYETDFPSLLPVNLPKARSVDDNCKRLYTEDDNSRNSTSTPLKSISVEGCSDTKAARIKSNNQTAAELDSLFASLEQKAVEESLEPLQTFTETNTAPVKRQHSVRIDNLPITIQRSQIEEIIALYDPSCKLDLVQNECDGKETLSANIILLDDSVADYMVSCLDGAETLFEGVCSPIKCFKN